MTIGERIKRLREDKGISQTELADIIKTTKQNLYKYENNIITNIPSDKIEAIAKYFDISPSYIMGWENNLEKGLSKSVEYLQKQLNTLTNLEEVYGKNIKDLVCRATELNELGINKLFIYCCDLLEVPKYLKSPQIQMKKNNNIDKFVVTDEDIEKGKVACFETEEIAPRVSPEDEDIALEIIERAKREKLQKEKELLELFERAKKEQLKNNNK